MKLGILRNMVLMGSVLAVVVACGGGSGSGSGSGAPVVSYGPISGFGSAIVHDVHYDVVTSTVTEDGSTRPDNDSDEHRGLKLGMVVKVEGDHDDNGRGTATHIEYRNNLIGPAVVNAGQMTALGQIVNVTSTTVVAYASGAAAQNLNTTTVADALALISGKVIEVSGLVGVGGAIDATRIEIKDLGWNGVSEIKGTVASLAAGTFQINGLTVAYSPALPDLEHGALANDKFVEVKGTFDAATTTLTAAKVELVDEEGFGVTANASKAEIEGLVTAVNPPSQFTIGTQNQLVDASSAAYEPVGFGFGNIAKGTRLEVEGSLSGGTLTATKISVKH